MVHVSEHFEVSLVYEISIIMGPFARKKDIDVYLRRGPLSKIASNNTAH